MTTARDPAVLALYALHMTAAEVEAVLAGRAIRRPVWPPQRCQGAVVGLCVDALGAVIGEALLERAEAVAGAIALGLWFIEGPRAAQVLWYFGPVTSYRQALPHRRGRGMSSLMPAAPLGTLTQPRPVDWG